MIVHGRAGVGLPDDRRDGQIVGAVNDEALLWIGVIAFGQVEQAILALNQLLKRPGDLSDLPIAGVAPISDALSLSHKILNRVSRGGHRSTLSSHGCSGVEYRHSA